MQHNIFEILFAWSLVLMVDISVAVFFIRIGQGKNSRLPVDNDDIMLYNKRNKRG